MLLSTAEVMNFLKTMFLTAFVIICLSSAADGRKNFLVKLRSKKICQDRDIYKANHHIQWWCCYCSAGKFLSEDCSFGEPNSTKCTQCPFDRSNPDNQTYTLRPNRRKKCLRSFNASRCTDIRNTHWEMGSPTAPSYCKCNEGYFSPPHLLMIDGCNLHSPCEEGYEPYIIGNHTANTRCRKCPGGTFSNVSSPTDLCRPFSTCERKEAFLGNATSDVQCVEVVVHKEEGAQTYWVTISILIVAFSVAITCIVFRAQLNNRIDGINQDKSTSRSGTHLSSEQRNGGFSSESVDKDSRNPMETTCEEDSTNKLLQRSNSNGSNKTRNNQQHVAH